MNENDNSNSNTNSNTNDNNDNREKRNDDGEEEKEELMESPTSTEMKMEMEVGGRQSVNLFLPDNNNEVGEITQPTSNLIPTSASTLTSPMIENEERLLQQLPQNNGQGGASPTHGTLLYDIYQDAAAYPDPIYADSNSDEGEVNSNSNSISSTSKNQRRQIVYYAIAVVVIVIGVGTAIGIRVYLNSRRNRNNKSSLYPDCLPLQFQWSDNQNDKLGDGTCDRSSNVNTNLNSANCGYDEGDCDYWNNKYKDCVSGTHPSELGDMGSKSSSSSTSSWELCNVKYNTKECGFDDGNCIPFNDKYPNCTFHSPYLIGDGICTAWNREPESDSQQNNSSSSSKTLISLMNSEECGWEGGDCIDDEQYPGCRGVNINHLGDGTCDMSNNTTECKFDGGDCI